MLILLAAGALWLVIWVLSKIAHVVSQAASARRATIAAHRRWEEQRRSTDANERKRRRDMNAKARALQVALLQLPRAHDFRRAASFAAQAKKIPAAFRQRQFRRFRLLLLRHYVARLRAGTDATVLLESLRQLVGQLSMPAYEADYIRDAAQAALNRPTEPERRPTYAERLAAFHREHVGRTETLRQLESLDSETRDQMLEAEETRYRQALQEFGMASEGSASQ